MTPRRAGGGAVGRLVVLLVAAWVALAGCAAEGSVDLAREVGAPRQDTGTTVAGGTADDDDAGDGADVGDDGDVEDGDGDDGDGEGDGDGAGGGTDPEGSGGSTSTTEFAADPGAPLCQQLRDTDFSELDIDTTATPEELAATLRTVIEVLDDTLAQAPPELEADVRTVRDGVAAIDAQLAAHGYDVEALVEAGDADELLVAVDDPEFAEANERLSRYRTEACGL